MSLFMSFAGYNRVYYMDLQQQQAGIGKTDNPQAITQPTLSGGATNLQQNGTANVNQLSAPSISVTSSCTTRCSGSIPPQVPTAKKSGMSGGVWIVIVVGVLVVATIGGMFRRLLAPNT